VPGVTLLPLAIEYTYWDERLPETFLRFGEPIRLADGIATEEATTQLGAALAQTMHALESDVLARDPRAFRVLLAGGRGTGGLYSLGRRLSGWITRTPHALDHTQRDELPLQHDDR
jgi:hypothetical protein